MSAIVLMLLLSSREDALARANAAYEEGLRLARAEQLSRKAFLAAAEGYEALLPGGPSLYRALGNARWMAGDLPRAVLAYRMGLRLAPHDDLLRVCLIKARERVARPDGATLGLPPEDVRSWLPGTWTRFLLALACWSAAWAGFARWRMTRLRRWLSLAVVCAVIGAALAGWLAIDALAPSPRPLAVVAIDGLLLRRGDGEQFPPRHELPLNKGTEAEIVARRGSWLLVEVRGGSGWVPAEAMACEE